MTRPQKQDPAAPNGLIGKYFFDYTLDKEGVPTIQTGRVMRHIEDARYQVQFDDDKQKAELYLRDLRKFYFFPTVEAMQQRIHRLKYQVIGR